MEGLLNIRIDDWIVQATGIGAAAVLFILCVVHYYWALGGKKGLHAAIPEYEGIPLYAPTPLSAFIIAFFLMLGGMVILLRTGLFGLPEPRILYEWSPWVMTALFFLRAMGDFRFIGLFKKIHDTKFAHWDGLLFTPVSMLMFLACLIVASS